MKNHRFLWLRNRTTNNRKCEKARNIKEKRTIEMFSTVSKQPVAHLSFQRDKQLSANKMDIKKPGMLAFTGFFVSNFVHWNARMTEMKRSDIEVFLRSQITMITWSTLVGALWLYGRERCDSAQQAVILSENIAFF